MTVQRANSELSSLLSVDLMGNAFEYLHEPIGDIGIWNGQFETGGDPYPEGWMLGSTLTGLQFLRRVAGGLAGNWCMEGGNTGTGSGAYLVSLRYIPVDETRPYHVSAALRGATAGSTVAILILCYDAAKTFIGSILPLSSVAPGVAWARYERRVGAGTATVFTAGTRYARVLVGLQLNPALTGNSAFVDDVQFQQMKASTSSLLTLNSGYAVNTVVANENATVRAIHSTFNLTLTEPGYIWAFADASLSHNTAGGFKFFADLQVNATSIGSSWYGAAAAYFIGSTFAGRSTAILPAGVYAVSYGFNSLVVGEVTTCWRSQISGFWHRSA